MDKYFGNVDGLIGWASEQIMADYLFIVQKDSSDKRLDKYG